MRTRNADLGMVPVRWAQLLGRRATWVARTLAGWLDANLPSAMSAWPPILAGALASTWVALSRPGSGAAMVGLAAGGMALLVTGIVSSRAAPVAIAVGVWGGAFVASRAGRALDAIGAAAFGALLLAVFELSSRAAATVPRTGFPAGAGHARLVAGTSCALGGLAVAGTIGAVAGLGWGTSPVLAVAGGIAAPVATGLLVLAIAAPKR